MPFLSEKFDQAVGKNRSCTALVDEAGRSWTFGQLHDEVRCLSARIRNEVPGNAVGILLLNSQRYLVSMLAI